MLSLTRKSFFLRPKIPNTLSTFSIATYHPTQVTTSEKGSRFDENWSMYFHAKENQISPWQHLPLVETSLNGNNPSSVILSPKTHFYFVNEISRGKREKLECAPKQDFNPIIQDRNKKDNSLRKFSYGDMPFCYGFLPRTFEDPDVEDTRTNKRGDGDPVDVVLLQPACSEIAKKEVGVGEILPVRLVGAFALLDQGETDWKMLAVPLDATWKNVKDVPKEVLYAVHDWFKMYKTTDGKPENEFAFDGNPLDADFAVDVVAELAQQYLDCLSTPEKRRGKFWAPSN